MRENRRRAAKIDIPESPRPEKTPWFWLISLAIPWLRVFAAIEVGRWLWKLWKRKKRSDYRSYVSVIGSRRVVPLAEFAAKLGKPASLVASDLRAMISKGYLGPDAYIDQSRGELVIEAMESDYGYEEPPREEEHPAEEPPKAEPKSEPRHAAPKINEDDFEEKLRMIRDLNDEIADEEVSARIDRIGELTASIFTVVTQKPERMDEVKKFMNYYLPTTFKLLKSYSLMEKQSYQGANITASRRKIEEILDSLVKAFEQQQDRLFQSEALDVEADIEVLETMMAKDGLVTPKGADIRSVMEMK